MGAKGLRWSDVLESAPESWKRVPFGEVFEERKEQNHPSLPLLSVTAEDGVVPRDSLARRDTSNPDKSKYLRVCPGDIVYNTMRMWQGVSALVPEEGIVSPAYTVCTPRPSIDATFASYLLKVQALVNVFRNRSQGLVDDTLSLRFDEFAKIHIPLPPLVEQKRIAEIIGSVDEAIKATLAVIEQTRRVKQGMLQELLTRGIGHTRFKQTEIGEVPEGWEVVQLQQVLEGIEAGWSPACPDEPPPPGDWGVLKVSAVTWGEFEPLESKRLPEKLDPRPHLEVRSGDVLMARANGVAELVGRTVFVHSQPEQRLMLSDKTLRLLPKKSELMPRFLNNALSSEKVRAQIKDMWGGSSGQKNIAQRQIRSIRIPLPPREEQAAIERVLRTFDENEGALRQESNGLSVIRAGLIQSLLTGIVRVFAHGGQDDGGSN